MVEVADDPMEYLGGGFGEIDFGDNQEIYSIENSSGIIYFDLFEMIWNTGSEYGDPANMNDRDPDSEFIETSNKPKLPQVSANSKEG